MLSISEYAIPIITRLSYLHQWINISSTDIANIILLYIITLMMHTDTYLSITITITLSVYYIYNIFNICNLSSNITTTVTHSYIGGGNQTVKYSNYFKSDILFNYDCFIIENGIMIKIFEHRYSDIKMYQFNSLCTKEFVTLNSSTPNFILCSIPIHTLINQLPKASLQHIGLFYKLDTFNYNTSTADHHSYLLNNTPFQDNNILAIFHPRLLKLTKLSPNIIITEPNTDNNKNNDNITFPPKPITDADRNNIISSFISETSPDFIEETGCAMCGELQPKHSSILLSSLEDKMLYLKQYNTITRKERKQESDLIEIIDDLVIDRNCTHVCISCANCIRQQKIPKNALANGLWIGDIPKELSDLTWIEKRLIARVRLLTYVVQVSSGRQKMKGNVIAFANPTPKIYSILPPPLDELDQLLAVVFVGPTRPTDEELRRTPLLVRRNSVAIALRWLKLNHTDYHDIDISENNLNEYPSNDIPLTFIYSYATTNKGPENTSVHDTDEDDGIDEGDCPFIVHGLLGNDIKNKSYKVLTTMALQRLKEGGKVLAIGHNSTPESIFSNPTLYPQMFPWLFPYGKGGIQNENIKIPISTQKQKSHYLMYHDKRFQLDKHFPIVAFNHEQIQSTSTSSYLLTKKSCFKSVTENILSIHADTLNNIIERLKNGEHVQPSTSDEKKCYKIIHDIDHITKDMDGSLTAKKNQRVQLWSMLAYHGAPSWFITFSPADKRHPIALYYADKKTTFNPIPYSDSDKYRLIAENPVAGARFFHVFVNAFLKHILGVNTNHNGIFGKTKAYYGTVEQQGRLTLHLHMLLWIQNAMSPQQIHD